MTPSQIRRLRRLLDLNQDEFGDALGFKEGPGRVVSVSRLENGKRKPWPQTVMLMNALAEGLKD